MPPADHPAQVRTNLRGRDGRPPSVMSLSSPLTDQSGQHGAHKVDGWWLCDRLFTLHSAEPDVPPAVRAVTTASHWRDGGPLVAIVTVLGIGYR